MRSNPKPLYRMILVDHLSIFQGGLETVLKNSKLCEITGVASTAAQVCAPSFSLDADIALVDLDLPDRSGLEVCQWLAQQQTNLKVFLLVYQDWDVYLAAAKLAHACGVVLRNEQSQNLLQIFSKACDGPLFTPQQTERIHHWETMVGVGLRSLRQREWDLLWFATDGASNREISQTLKISENTVEKHMGSLLQKLSLPNRAMMMVYVHTHHLDVLRRVPHLQRLFNATSALSALER